MINVCLFQISQCPNGSKYDSVDCNVSCVSLIDLLRIYVCAYY